MPRVAVAGAEPGLTAFVASYWEGEGVKSLANVANLADVTRRLSGAFATCSRLWALPSHFQRAQIATLGRRKSALHIVAHTRRSRQTILNDGQQLR